MWSPKNPKIEQEIYFDLKVIDTPGIADSQGRSKQFLNEIAKTIKTTPLNLIIVLVEYGRMDTVLSSNLEVLRECLNGMSQSKSMLIINKVPTEKTLEQKRKKGEECRDRKEVLNEMFKAISNAFGGKFKYELFLENEDLEGAEENNKEQYNLIKIFTFFRYSCVNTQMVRTWDEIVTFSNTEISDQSLGALRSNPRHLSLEAFSECALLDRINLGHLLAIFSFLKMYITVVQL